MPASPTASQLHLSGYAFDPREGEPELPAALRLPPASAGAAYFVVQLHRAPTREERAHLQRRHGLRLRDYVAHHGYVELLAPVRAGALDDDPLVRARISYQPAYKLAPSLAEDSPQPAPEVQAPPRPLRLRATLFEGTDAAVAADAIRHAGGQDVSVQDDRALGGSAVARFTLPDASALPGVAAIGAVRWIEPVTDFSKDSPTAASLIQSGKLDAPAVWERGLHGEGQIVGIIDSGAADLEHCFFADDSGIPRPGPNPDPRHRKVVQARNAADAPPQEHATFVAGCVAGDDRDEPGGSETRGGAWAARLVLGVTHDVQFTSLLAELSRAAEAGATIHNHSWHDDTQGPGRPALYNQTAADTDAFLWRNEAHLVLGSAGNIGEELGPPGTAKSALCVGAAHTAPHIDERADGNPGPTAEGRLKPDLMAVGCAIRSAKHGTECETGEFLDMEGVCATSFACAHAAAAAALVRQYLTEGYFPTGRPDPLYAREPSGALLKALLVASCVDMRGVPGFPSFEEGWGLIRLGEVLDFGEGRRRLQLWDRRHEDGLATGESFRTQVQVEAGEPLRVTLAWSDAPAQPGATLTTVNDLDLVVVAPDGETTFVGNHFGGPWSAPGADPERDADATNPLERVLIDEPTPGLWSIEVRARAVHRGEPGQGFAIVVTGALTDVDLELLRGHERLLRRLDALIDAQPELLPEIVQRFEALVAGFADLLDARMARLGYVEPDLLQSYECLLLGVQNALRRLAGLPRQPLPPECGGPTDPDPDPGDPKPPDPDPDPPEPLLLPDLVPLPPPTVVLPPPGSGTWTPDADARLAGNEGARPSETLPATDPDTLGEAHHLAVPGDPIVPDVPAVPGDPIVLDVPAVPGDPDVPAPPPAPPPARGYCGDRAPWSDDPGAGLVAGSVRVLVRNVGNAPAPPSVTSVDFYELGEIRFQPTAALDPGEDQLLEFRIPRSDNPRADCYGADGACRYRITVNAERSFAEHDHENNVVESACVVGWTEFAIRRAPEHHRR